MQIDPEIQERRRAFQRKLDRDQMIAGIGASLIIGAIGMMGAIALHCWFPLQ